MLDRLSKAPGLLISTADAKVYLKVDHNDEDALIEDLIASAQEFCEEYTGHALSEQTYQFVCEAEGGDGDDVLSGYGSELNWYAGLAPLDIVLPIVPLISITKVTKTDWQGNDVELDVNLFRILSRDPGTVRARDGRRLAAKALTFEYKVGYAEANTVPAKFRTAMRLLMAHWYENREASTPANRDLREPPFSVKTLLDTMKAVRL